MQTALCQRCNMKQIFISFLYKLMLVEMIIKLNLQAVLIS